MSKVRSQAEIMEEIQKKAGEYSIQKSGVRKSEQDEIDLFMKTDEGRRLYDEYTRAATVLTGSLLA